MLKKPVFNSGDTFSGDKEKNMKITNTQEFNDKAKELKEAGDTQGLQELAKKYGIEKEDLEDYLDGAAKNLATPLILALAAVEEAKKELDTKGVIADWLGVLASMAAGSEELADAITFDGKKIKDLLGKILKQAFETKIKVHDDIAKAAGIRTPLYMGIPGTGDIKKIIGEFYGVTV